MLLGRTQELDRIHHLVDEVRRGQGSALVLIGEPGIGKTTLLERAFAEARGLRVIGVSGVEVEATLPYASLAEIVDPLLEGLGQLPEAQGNAIRAALALGPSPGAPADRFATCEAFLGLLTGAAESEPLLVVVDDAQWLDEPSAECVAYAARRLSGRSMGLLAAARPGRHGPLLGSRNPDRLELSRLDAEHARAVIRAAAPEATASVVEALVGIAAGNPLALRELSSRLTREQRLGLATIDYERVVGTALNEAFEAQLMALDAEARSAVVLASCAIDRGLQSVASACRDLGIDSGALERAETSGVIVLKDGRVDFSHPLLKAVAHEHAVPAQRRRAHRALAGHCGPDAHAWHLAAATIGPDEGVAELLDAAAERATARGAHSVAADALAEAAGLSDDERAAGRRLYGAALSATLGGAYDRCAALLESAPEVTDPLLRARVQHAMVVVKMTGGVGLAPDAHSQLSAAADRISEIDPATAAPIHADASMLAGVSGDLRFGALAASKAAAEVPDGASAMVRCQVKAMEGAALALTGTAKDARESLDEAGRLLTGIDTLSPATQSVVLGLHARVCAGQEQLLRTELERLEGMARATDTFGLLPYLLAVLGDVAFRTGEWQSGGRYSSSADLAEEHGQYGILPFSLVVSGQLHAAQGRTSQAENDIGRGLELAERLGSAIVVAWGHWALGLLRLGRGHAEDAAAELVLVETFVARSGLEDPAYVPWAADLVESYVQLGRSEDAGHAAASLALRARRAGVPLSLALAERGLGLAAGDDFKPHFETAMRHHKGASAPFQEARTLLAYGSRLHRARQRVEARVRLRAALEVFEALEAHPWIERTKSELAASGAVKRERVADPDELSPQEIRVARAVAGGVTNKQAAAQMFLSPKTIDFHLGRVYRKLGIHSRTELARLVASGALDRPIAAERVGPKQPGADSGDC